MRIWIVIAVVAVLVVAAGGGYYGLEVYPQQQFKANLDQALAALPAGTTATYKTARYSVLSHQAVVTGWTMHGLIPGNPSQSFDLTIDSIETGDPNLEFAASWARAEADPKAFGPQAAIPVAGSIAVKGLTIHSAIVNLTEDSAQIAKLRLYPWALLHEGVPSWTEVWTVLQPRSRPPQLADVQAIARAEAALMLGVAWDSHAAGVAKVTETLPGVEVQYHIQKMTGGPFDRGVMQGAAGEGISFTGEPLGAFAVDRVSMDGMDVRAPMTRLLLGEALSPALLDGVKIGRIEYHGIMAQPSGKPAIHIGRLWVGPVAFAQGMPVSGELGWMNIRILKSQLPDPRAQDAFARLDLQSMTISVALAYDWDVARRHASLHDSMVKIDELGTLALSADLDNVVATAGAWNSAQLAHARLRFDDATLVNRLLRAGAAQTGADPEAYRQQIVSMVQQQTMIGGDASPALRAAGKAAADFIISPNSLTIELAPPAPVPLIALLGAAKDPGGSAATLGLTVTANK